MGGLDEVWEGSQGTPRFPVSLEVPRIVDRGTEGSEVKREKENMFPGWSLSSAQLLQDIRDNHRSQTLVSVPGFTAKHHMFVQPLSSGRGVSPPSYSCHSRDSCDSCDSRDCCRSCRSPRGAGSSMSTTPPVASHEPASSSTLELDGGDGGVATTFVPTWVKYHGVVRFPMSRWTQSACFHT